MSEVNIREAALQILTDIEQKNKDSRRALQAALMRLRFEDKTKRAFLSKLVSGTMERKLFLDHILDQVSKTPMKKCKPVIRSIMRMTVYQIWFMDSVPDTAAVDEAVKLAKKKGFMSLSGFVNGVLRNVIRKREEITFPEKEQDFENYLSVMYSTPLWLIKKLLKDYDRETVETVLKSTLVDRKTTIRVNTKKISLEELKLKISEAGITVSEADYLPERAIKIFDFDHIKRVPGFKEGYFYVQDESSMLVGEISGVKDGDIVYDLCAAPGGKSTDMAERGAIVTSFDLTEEKCDLIRENIERTGAANITVARKDGTEYDEDLKETADIVICDLPCSGLGVMGKHPDIKYRLKEEELKELVILQKRILDNAYRYLKNGGTLILSTCTINPDENEKNRAYLLDNYDLKAEAFTKLLPEELRRTTTELGYLTLIPGEAKCDGFFIAKYKKEK